MAARVIDIEVLLTLGAQLRAELRSIATEPLPQELFELAAALARAIEARNWGGAADHDGQDD